MLLEQKVFVVTGAAGNLGTATVREFLREGADVFAATRTKEQFEALVSDMPHPEHLKGGGYDLARADEAERLTEEALAAFGALHGVVNLVGGWAGGAPVAETPDSVFDGMIALNLRTAWNISRAAMRALAAERGGCIVHVGATWALHMSGVEGAVAYNVAKAGVLALTRALALEGKPLGVRANAVAPGSMARRDLPAGDPRNAGLVPPEQVARAMAFLCSDGALEVTGTVVDLPGRPYLP